MRIIAFAQLYRSSGRMAGRAGRGSAGATPVPACPRGRRNRGRHVERPAALGLARNAAGSPRTPAESRRCRDYPGDGGDCRGAAGSLSWRPGDGGCRALVTSAQHATMIGITAAAIADVAPDANLAQAVAVATLACSSVSCSLRRPQARVRCGLHLRTRLTDLGWHRRGDPRGPCAEAASCTFQRRRRADGHDDARRRRPRGDERRWRQRRDAPCSRLPVQAWCAAPAPRGDGGGGNRRPGLDAVDQQIR
jgi:hypothetical protein